MLRRTRFLAMALGFAAAVATPAGAAPNDALQDEQWAFAPSALFDLPAAWNLSQGAGVVVAVVDSGMKLDHPDLAPNVWTNFGEIPGNGVDDDNNGYVDDLHGVDLTTANANNDLHDGFGHGTHVSGTIAAAANGKGVVGVAFRAKIMTVKVLDDAGGGTTGAVAEGIRYAAANGARVINLSLESTTDDPRMRAAVQAAVDANALIVASAGNSGLNVDSRAGVPGVDPVVERHRRRRDGARRRPRPARLLQLRKTDRVGRRTRRRRPLDLDGRRLRGQVGHVDGRAARRRRGGADGRRLAQHARRRPARAAAAERDARHGAGELGLRRRARQRAGGEHRLQLPADAARAGASALRDPEGATSCRRSSRSAARCRAWPRSSSSSTGERSRRCAGDATCSPCACAPAAPSAS